MGGFDAAENARDRGDLLDKAERVVRLLGHYPLMPTPSVQHRDPTFVELFTPKLVTVLREATDLPT
jgi:hypothetical protein